MNESMNCPKSLKISYLNNKSKLPLIIQPSDSGKLSIKTLDDLISEIGKNQDWLEKQLLIHGGILFRGFPLKEAQDLECLVKSFGKEMVAYTHGQSPRTKVHNLIYNSTEYNSTKFIELHNELSYTNHAPAKIFFFCHTPSMSGGETPILDCRSVLKKLDPIIIDRLLDKKVCYVMNMIDEKDAKKSYLLGKSWQQQFETSSRDAVEKQLIQDGLSFEWKENGVLRTKQIIPAIIKHPITSELVWHNQANVFHHSTYGEIAKKLIKMMGEENLPINAFYGDYTPISEEEMNNIKQVLWAESISFSWQQGDLLMLDNLRVAHGRKPFKGERLILTAMTR